MHFIIRALMNVVNCMDAWIYWIHARGNSINLEFQLQYFILFFSISGNLVGS